MINIAGEIKEEYVQMVKSKDIIFKKKLAATKLSMVALLSQLTIDAFEERKVSLFEVPGAYLNSFML